MARMARLVVPGCPHHVTQRGNRRLEVFFRDEDYQAYLDLLAEWAELAGTRVWAYCLMHNHVHLILVPSHEDDLRATLGEAHRRYTRMINFRQSRSHFEGSLGRPVEMGKSALKLGCRSDAHVWAEACRASAQT